MDTFGSGSNEPPGETAPLRSTLYKCSVHGVWLILVEAATAAVGARPSVRFRFWQCPFCGYAKPCKNRHLPPNTVTTAL
jgi:hypothetical protein